MKGVSTRISLAAALGLCAVPLAAAPAVEAASAPLRTECPVRHDGFHGVEIQRAPRQDYTIAPALWKLSDADTTIHIFGTIHVLPEGFRWRTALFDKVAAEAEEVVFESRDEELAPPEGETSAEDQRFLDLMARYAASVPLSERVAPRNRAKLARIMTLAGIEPAEADKLPPVIAMFTLSAIHNVAEGSLADFGVETVIEKEFRDSGRPVGAIEDPVAVMESLLAIDEGQIVAMLDAELDLWDGCALVSSAEADWSDEHSWARGRMAEADIAEMSDDPFEKAFYKAILVDRNRAWTGWLAERMKRPGKLLLAVGAAHLEGPDSVPLMLEKEGLTVERVQ
ncbi:TraB/GumN family protein [Erythrobacter sp. NE805]|uniref:TraB/GumN family protein n=1 Tax=Erythrobacter sp. NE805 TaxID=3389875 RepID=UPI00396B383A